MTLHNPSLNDNLRTVLSLIAAACQASGRRSNEVRLLAVAKTFSAAAVRQLAACNQLDFGENYIQEGVDKILSLQDCQPALVWHCIGPVQSNKTKLVAEHFDWVHTIDRFKTAQRLSRQRPPHLPPLNVCLQVNIDGAAGKSGVAPHATMALALEIRQLPRLALRGLMTLPEPVLGLAAQMQVHQQAKALFDQMKAELNLPGFDTLSMGMSSDLEAAVRAGSTMVRVGTAIFGTRQAAP